MKHLGDFDTSAVIYGKFTTFRPSTGAAYTLGGTPALSVYKDSSTTQSTTGVTLTADFDSVTGLNHFAIDTSADGTFYSSGSFFDVVITTGTVDSVSVVGAVVGSFTLRKNSALKPATAGRTVVVDASGLVDANTVKVGPTGSGTAQTAGDIIGDTNDIQSRLPAALTAGGNIKADAVAINAVATTSVTTINAHQGTTNAVNFNGSGVSGYVKADVRTVTGNAQSAGDIVANQDVIYNAVVALPTAAQNADAVWDEEYTSHASITGSTAELMSDINASTSALTSRITSSLFTGITSMAQWLGLMAGKQTPNSTALTEIKATGAGSGTYDATTDSLQAIRDSGGGSGASLTVDATYVDTAHTWTFPSSVQTTATRIINELIGFNGIACMDFTNVIPSDVAISSVDSASFANISGTEPTVGTSTVSTNLKKVLIPINATSATANTYTLSVTVTTTDSQQFTRNGQFTVA